MLSLSRKPRLWQLVAALFLSAEVSFAWVGSSPSSQSKKSPNLQTAKYYKSIDPKTVISEEAALEAAAAVKEASETNAISDNDTDNENELSKARQLPWMSEGGPDANAETNTFLEHWNWQFSFFEENLTNLRVRVDAEHEEDFSDLYYATKEMSSTAKQSQSRQRCYTISLESDEYRDIRMTYIHCPAMQTFRCLSYPRDGDLPIMGMGIMKMGGVRNLAILDYQPLPEDLDENDTDNDDDETKSRREGRRSRINEAYTKELLELHKEIPSMGQSMTHRHFDSQDSRKYFTDFPLLGRSNDLESTEAEQAGYQRDLVLAQTKYVAKHTELTKAHTTRTSTTTTTTTASSSSSSSSLSPTSSSYVLRRHSDFDTHIAQTEPAGPFLKGIFGPELGGKLVHNVIFPLSKKGTYGKSGGNTGTERKTD